MEIQKKMISGNVFRSMADDNDLKNDFVPYGQVKDTISKIQVLKAAYANVHSFLPSWADDEYFMQLHKSNKMKRNVFERSVETENTMLEEKSEDKTSIESGQITHSVHKISGEELNIKTEDAAVYTLSIIEKARAIVLPDVTIHKLDQDDGSVMEDVNTSDESQDNECLQKPVKLKELFKQKTKPVKNGLDKPGELTALETGKISKFIPRKLFLSNIETFKHPTEFQDSKKSQEEESKSEKPTRPLQYRFLCTTGLSPADEPRVVRPRRTLRDRILGFFGLSENSRR